MDRGLGWGLDADAGHWCCSRAMRWACRICDEQGKRVQVQLKNDFRPSVWKCVRRGVSAQPEILCPGCPPPAGNLVSRVSASRKKFAIHKGGHSVYKHWGQPHISLRYLLTDTTACTGIVICMPKYMHTTLAYVQSASFPTQSSHSSSSPPSINPSPSQKAYHLARVALEGEP